MGRNLREHKGSSLAEYLDNYIVIDIETTGFSPAANEIIEIAALKVVDGIVSDHYQTLVKPNDEIPPNITRLTGITDHMVESEGVDAEYAIKMIENFIGKSILVGHNVHFDINFLYDYFLRYLKKPLSNDFVDTQRLAKSLVKDTYNHKLPTLAKRFKLSNNNAHRALNDVFVTNDLYRKLQYLDEHYVEVSMAEIRPHLRIDEMLCNRKVAIKSNLRYIEEPVLNQLLLEMGSRAFYFMHHKADMLLVNDATFIRLQEPLDKASNYVDFFNGWEYEAKRRIHDGSLFLVSESEFCDKVGIPISCRVIRKMNESNPLFGKTCVFTGVLDRMSRKQAETIVETIGGSVGSNVTRKTNFLILGNNDYNASVKEGKSTKHRRAEELQSQDHEIDIIPEDMFYDLIDEE